jgi:hypothetical protein
MAWNKFFKDKNEIMQYEKNLFASLGFDVDDLIKHQTLLSCPDAECTGKRAGFYMTKEYNFVCRCNHCEKIFDVIQFFQAVQNLDPALRKSEVVPKIFEYIKENNIPKDAEEKIKVNNTFETDQKTISNVKSGNYIDYFLDCRENLKEDFDYMLKRGFLEEDKESLYNLGIGLDKKENSIIFPITKGSFIKRYIVPIKISDDKEIRYRNSKKLTSEDHFCFNLDKLRKYDKNIIFICEGIMDAVTLHTINKDYLAIASGGASSNHNKILNELKDYSKDKKVIALLLLDNDDAGDSGTRDFKEELGRTKNIYALDVRKQVINYNIFTKKIEEERRKRVQGTCVQDDFYFIENKGEKIEDHNRFCYKDVNEMFQKDRINLEKNIKEVNKYGEEFLKEILEEEKKKKKEKEIEY